MHLLHFYQGHKTRHLHLTSFWLYELSIWLHTLSLSLVWVFIPILILKSGYDLSTVIAYYLVYNLADVPLSLLAREFIRVCGARWSIVIATAAIIMFFILFSFLQGTSLVILFLLALCVAVYDSFYWVANLYLFVNSDKAVRHTGRNTGVLYAVRQIALLLGPAIGAVILIFLGQTWVLAATIVGLAISLIPLWKLSGYAGFTDTPKEKPLSVTQFFSKGGKRTFVSAACYAFHDTVENNLLPLFIFLSIGTLSSVAVIPVLVSCAAILFALTLGRLKPARRELVMLIGALALALIWVVRLAFPDATFLYLSILATGLLAQLILIPLDSSIFEHARRVKDPLTASTYRNVTYMGMNIVLYGTLYLLLNVFDAAFAIACTSLVALIAVNGACLFMMRRSRATPAQT